MDFNITFLITEVNSQMHLNHFQTIENTVFLIDFVFFYPEFSNERK